MIKFKHNRNVIYSDCLLCRMSVAQSIFIRVGRSREKDSREALLTQHPQLYLFNTLKVHLKKCSFRISQFNITFSLEKTFCQCLESKTFKFFLNCRAMILKRFCNQTARLNPFNLPGMMEVQQCMEFLRKYIYRNRLEKMELIYFSGKFFNQNGLGLKNL